MPQRLFRNKCEIVYFFQLEKRWMSPRDESGKIFTEISFITRHLLRRQSGFNNNQPSGRLFIARIADSKAEKTEKKKILRDQNVKKKF